MKIAIVCDPIDLNQKTGIPVYCEKMVREFMKDKWNEYVFFHMKENPLFDGYEDIVFLSGQTFWFWNAIRSLWRKFYLMPREFRKREIQIVHELNTIGSHILNPFKKYKTVVTVFDLTPLIFPKYHWFLTVLAFRLFVGLSVKLADRVVSISQATKDDIVRIYGIPKKKVNVTLLGTDVLERSEDSTIHFDFPFILSVGTLEPRKNLKNLIKAFVAMKESGQGKGIKLVLSWKKWWKTESFFNELILNKEFMDDIILTGFLTDSQLVHLYKTCQIFVYPSYYEWFWLPVLEAMSLGAPVITSNVSSIPEVAWNACVMINPDSVSEISQAMVRLIENDSFRTECSRRGIEQSKKFSWTKAAQETVSVYRDLFKP